MKSKYILIYDFDGTLTPYSLPKFAILERSGLKDGAYNPKFLEMVKERAKTKNIDLNLAMYEIYFEIIKKGGFSLSDYNFCLGADEVQYNIGVVEFLENLSKQNVKNYLVSLGPKVFLEKTEISLFFEKIYGTIFNYDKNKEVTEIQYLMSDKNKVEAIQEIIADNQNEPNDCSNVIYIGDGLTDFYAMQYVKENNGISIFLYQDEYDQDVISIKGKNVVDFFFPKDFSLNGQLNQHIKKFIKKG